MSNGSLLPALLLPWTFAPPPPEVKFFLLDVTSPFTYSWAAEDEEEERAEEVGGGNEEEPLSAAGALNARGRKDGRVLLPDAREEFDRSVLKSIRLLLVDSAKGCNEGYK